MTNRRIDTLREMVAEIGRRQQDYITFFPRFAERLATALGLFLEDEDSVAISTDKPDFHFGEFYHQEGQGIIEGKYRIPLMVRLRNMDDDGHLVHRFFLYCSKSGDRVSVAISNLDPIEFKDGKFEQVCKYIYQYLCDSFSSEQWFRDNKDDYNGSEIGFLANL